MSAEKDKKIERICLLMSVEKEKSANDGDIKMRLCCILGIQGQKWQLLLMTETVAGCCFIGDKKWEDKSKVYCLFTFYLQRAYNLLCFQNIVLTIKKYYMILGEESDLTQMLISFYYKNNSLNLQWKSMLIWFKVHNFSVVIIKN